MALRWEGQLALVTHHVQEAEIRIARQRQLIERSKEAGCSTVEAEKVLLLMVDVLATMRETEAVIRRLITSQLS